MLAKTHAAIDRAGILADQLNAEITLLHVVQPVESERALEQRLQTATEQMSSRAKPPLWRAHVSPHVTIQTGDPAPWIIDVLEKSRARLLVLGPHRKRPLQDVLKGTIVEKVLTTRKWPVLMVQNEARVPYQRVLLALDFSDASASAIRAAESLVLAPPIEAHVVHAHEPPYQGMPHYVGTGIETLSGYSADSEREAYRAIRDLLKRESADLTRYKIHIDQRRGALGVLGAINDCAPDVLVIGTRAGGRVHRALLGSVARQVLHGIECDALIVPVGSSRALHGQQVPGQRRRPP
jgi:nucleotide-binding universal stress UspA family protein